MDFVLLSDDISFFTSSPSSSSSLHSSVKFTTIENKKVNRENARQKVQKKVETKFFMSIVSFYSARSSVKIFFVFQSEINLFDKQ